MLEDDDGTDEAPRRTCTACGLVAPATSTNYTLISAKHGWRLAREMGPDGKMAAAWRCPGCWSALKGRPPTRDKETPK